MTSYKCTTGNYIRANYRVYVTSRLRYMPAAQAGVLDTFDSCGEPVLIMYSYITPVLIVTRGCVWCSGLYSNTTRRHISAFLREYFPNISYYDIKLVAGTHYGIDTESGEVVTAGPIEYAFNNNEYNAQRTRA